MSKTKKIIFSGTFLSINDSPINIKDFKEKIPEGIFTITEKTRVHIFSYSYDKNYLKVTFGDGSAMPRNPNVYDIEFKAEVPNPRKRYQAETRETFGLIDFNTSLLWLSNSKKKNSLIDYFRKKFKKSKLISKDVYDEGKFINTIKRLDNIRISAVPELFSQSNTLTKHLSEEINGYEASIAHLQLDYQNQFIGDNLMEKVKSLLSNRSNFKGIVISGRDEKNLGMLFNSDGFSRKIELKALINNNEMFIKDDVFLKLISKIEDENN